MQHFLDVSAIDIAKWADSVDAKNKFPELIRKLIIASAPYLLHVDFPSADNIYESGWDGIVTDAVGTTFIPEGESAWELGTNKNKKQKADEDYKARTQNPLGVNPVETTIVLATPRNWAANSKRDWVLAKEGEHFWKGVRLLDAKDVELWLTMAPAVQYWFSHLLGKRPSNVTDIESYWADWAAATTPPLPPAFLTLGRQSVVDKIYSWLKKGEDIFGLRADSQAEALAVFAAAIQELPDDERLSVAARCVVVFTLEAWRDLTSRFSSLLLIPFFQDRASISGALQKGHQVFVPLDRAGINWKHAVTELPRLQRLEVQEFLFTLNFSRDRAELLAGIARRSFAAFRRALTDPAAVETPIWVHTEQRETLVAALLAGAWDEQYEQDSRKVGEIANLPYEEVESHLIRLLSKPDPPVRRVGSTWFIIDTGDVWSLLADSITQEQLKLFCKAVVDVLGSIPPRYDLPASEWYRASMLGKTSPFSGTLRENLATTLAYMGSLEDPLEIAGTFTSDLAMSLVRELLQKANKDWRIWSSLSHNLRWLAEAAPDAFLEAVKVGMEGEQPVIMTLFEERKDILNTSSDHAGLLWALEVLAWSPRYLLRATRLLAKLDRLDPGGALVNRPLESLREIFLPWYPHTGATLAQRLQVFDDLQRREPSTANRLLAVLGSRHRSISSGTAKPRWRDWVPARNVSVHDVYDATLDVHTRLLREAKQDIARWEAIIEDFPESPYEQREAVIIQLDALSQKLTSDADRVRLRDKLREIISRHRSFHEMHWAMPSELVDRLATLMEQFEPVDILEKYAWLFTDWPLLPEGKEQDSTAYAARIGERQREALNLLFSQGGLELILSLTSRVKSPLALGRTLVQAKLTTDGKALELVTIYLRAEHEAGAAFGLGIASALIAQRPEPEQQSWATTTLAAHKSIWQPLQQAEWLRLFKANPQTWELVSELPEDAQDYYWQTLIYFFVEEEDSAQGAALFLQHEQFTKAVELLGREAYQDRPIPTALAIDALEQLLRNPSSSMPSSTTVESILEKLAEASDADRQRVIQLEFTFLSASFFYREGKGAKLIYQELNNNPALFAEVVARVFRAEGEESRVLTQEESNLNMASWHLLDSWRIVPGTQLDGKIDQAYLFTWVEKARQLLRDLNRQRIGDEQIGQLLSGSPKGSDGIWPHEAVRALLEDVDSNDIERGFIIGHYNDRGTTVRNPYEGGAQERVLASEYSDYAHALEITSPRTAEVLRNIAKDYERQAKREDEEASLNQDLP